MNLFLKGSIILSSHVLLLCSKLLSPKIQAKKNLVTLATNLQLLKKKCKNTMKESVLVVIDVEVQEEELEVEQEEVVVEDVALEEVIEEVIEEVDPKLVMYLKQKEYSRENPRIEMKTEMKTEMLQEQEEKEDHIVEQILIKMVSVKEATATKDQEVKDTTRVKNLKVNTKETMDKMKEVQAVEPEVNQEITTTIKIDQEEMELKVVTTMRVKPEEEEVVLDHKLVMTDQPEVDQEVELLEAELLEVTVLVEEEP